MEYRKAIALALGANWVHFVIFKALTSNTWGICRVSGVVTGHKHVAKLIRLGHVAYFKVNRNTPTYYMEMEGI